MSIFKSFCIGSKDGKQRWVLLTTKELVRRDSVLTWEDVVLCDSESYNILKL